MIGMLEILAGGCRVSDMREGEPLTKGTLRIWNQIGQANGAQAISLRVMEFAPGLSPGIRNEDCDEILYLTDPCLETQIEAGATRPYDREAVEDSSQGQALSAPPLVPGPTDDSHPAGVRRKNREISMFINGWHRELTPDTGIYIHPGEVFAIDNPGSDPVIFISSQCPDPGRLPEFIEPMKSPLPESSPPHRLPIVRLSDRAPQSTADRWYRVLVDDEVGSAQVTQFVGSIPPGRAPDHFHNYEEVLFILKGEGRMWAGKTSAPIGSGSCIYLPKGQVHCVENTGTGELRLLGVFYPAGSPSVRYDA
jgi:mannose-6-phosphate isomerase-like protein (cupin superfamily)